FHGIENGWLSPRASVAREASVASPDAASQSYSKSTHEYGPASCVISASSQFSLPSVLTSTRAMPPWPDHAKPNTFCAPACVDESGSWDVITDFGPSSVTGRSIDPSSSI